MKIGFLVQNAYCGNSYVSKAFADAMSDEHEVFMFATEGYKHTDKSFWEGYNTYHSTTDKENPDPAELEEWINKNKIDAVFLNECLNWSLIAFLKEKGLKILGYIYYLKPTDAPYIKAYYDAMLLPSEHVYEKLVDLKNCHFVPWGIDTELFKPEEPEYDFFHSAGWGGIHFRKCTPEIIRAFHRLDRGTMLLHTQIPYFDTATKDRIKELREEGRLKVKIGTVDHPGLYHKGRVYLGVSKFEGLGLFVPEALACGSPVITTDRLPMSQFVRDGYNGWLVSSEEREGVDGFAFSSFKIDEDELLEVMDNIMNNKYNLEEMSENARESIMENHHFEKVFKPRVKEIVNKL